MRSGVVHRCGCVGRQGVRSVEGVGQRLALSNIGSQTVQNGAVGVGNQLLHHFVEDGFPVGLHILGGGLFVNRHLQRQRLGSAYQGGHVDLHVHFLSRNIHGVETRQIDKSGLAFERIQRGLGNLPGIAVPASVDLGIGNRIHAVQRALATRFCRVVRITAAGKVHLVLDVVVVTGGLSVHQGFEGSVGWGTGWARRRAEDFDQRLANRDAAYHDNLLGNRVVLRGGVGLSVGIRRPKLQRVSARCGRCPRCGVGEGSGCGGGNVNPGCCCRYGSAVVHFVVQCGAGYRVGTTV